MHQSRRTHNTHYETQKRLKGASTSYSNWSKSPRPRGEYKYYIEGRHSRKWMKKLTNKSLRKSMLINETNMVNAKTLSKVYERWMFLD